jgi:MoaA/NifB/PqqE/SkfB family radical SAM enzyme
MGITERIDSVTRIPPSHLGTVLPAPKSAKIEITANCTYRCSFCVKSLRPDNGVMDRKLFSRIIREMKDYGVEELGVFYIGESFTCRWLPDAIYEARSVGFPYIFLTTNGAIATPDRVQACMEAGLDSLKFSLNFTDPEQLREIAQVPGRHFDAVLTNLMLARKIRDAGNYKCGLYASSIAFDGEQGEKMRELVETIKPYVDEHYWLPLYSMGGASEAAGWQPKAGNPGRLGALRESLPCWSAFTEAHITKDGKLSACCFGHGSEDSLVMADLKEVSFAEGWNSPAYQELRQAHLNRDVSKTPCSACAAGG